MRFTSYLDSRVSVPTFLIEAYEPTGMASRLLTSSGAYVRWQQSSRAREPQCATCVDLRPGGRDLFHLFESPSIEGVEEVGRRAGLVFNRITEAVEPVITEGASPGTVAAPLVEMAVSDRP